MRIPRASNSRRSVANRDWLDAPRFARLSAPLGHAPPPKPSTHLTPHYSTKHLRTKHATHHRPRRHHRRRQIHRRRILVARGATHCDADKLVHRLYDPGTPGFDRVVEAFGPEIVGPDGSIDRKILGAKVFGKPEEMARLTKAIGSITEAVKAEIDSGAKPSAPTT